MSKDDYAHITTPDFPTFRVHLVHITIAVLGVWRAIHSKFQSQAVPQRTCVSAI